MLIGQAAKLLVTSPVTLVTSHCCSHAICIHWRGQSVLTVTLTEFRIIWEMDPWTRLYVGRGGVGRKVVLIEVGTSAHCGQYHPLDHPYKWRKATVHPSLSVV